MTPTTQRATAAWIEWLRGEAELVTNNYVVIETAAVRALHEDVAPLLRIEWVSEQEHRAGMEAVLAAARRELSLVDCASFQTMRSCGIRTSFTFDAHFREQGFAVKP